VCGVYRRTPRASRGQTSHSSPRAPRLLKLPADGMCGCSALVAGGRPPPSAIPRRLRRRRGSSVRAEVSPGGESERKKVAVAGAGWAGLAAAHHLVKLVLFIAANSQLVLLIRGTMSRFSPQRTAQPRRLASEVFQSPVYCIRLYISIWCRFCFSNSFIHSSWRWA